MHDGQYVEWSAKDAGTSAYYRIMVDGQYATAAQLGSTAFSSSGGFVARPFPATGGEYPLVGSTFYAPGAPRSFWIGLRYSL